MVTDDPQVGLYPMPIDRIENRTIVDKEGPAIYARFWNLASRHVHQVRDRGERPSPEPDAVTEGVGQRHYGRADYRATRLHRADYVILVRERIPKDAIWAGFQQPAIFSGSPYGKSTAKNP